MGPIRNRSKEQYVANMNSSYTDKNEYQPNENISIEKYHSTHKTNIKSAESNEDCFVKFGFSSPSKENNLGQESEDNENKQSQTINHVEEIAAITALCIYNAFTRQQNVRLDRNQETNAVLSSNSTYDDIDRFYLIYSCFTNRILPENDHSNKSFHIQNHLCDRFVTLPDINDFNDFERNEQFRVYEERQAVYKRVPFIPNIRAYQRTCPYYNLNEIKKRFEIN